MHSVVLLVSNSVAVPMPERLSASTPLSIPTNNNSDAHFRYVQLAKQLSDAWGSLNQKSRFDAYRQIKGQYNLSIDYDTFCHFSDNPCQTMHPKENQSDFN